MRTLGGRLRALREEKDMTGRELAKTLNVSPSTLSQYETNTRIPSDDIKIKISDFFNVSIDYLMCRTNDPQSHRKAADEDEIRIEDIDYAFYGGMPGDLTEEEKERILAFARFMREERKKNK